MLSHRWGKGQKFQDSEGTILTVAYAWWRRVKRIERPFYSLQLPGGGYLLRGESRLVREIEQGKLTPVHV